MEHRISQRLLRMATAGFVAAAAAVPMAPVSAATAAEHVDSSPHRILLPYTSSGYQGNETSAVVLAQTENSSEIEPEPGQILIDSNYTTTVGVPITMDPFSNISDEYMQWLFHNGPWSIDVITNGLPFESARVREGLVVTPTLAGMLLIPVTLEFGDIELQVFNEVSYMNLNIVAVPTALPPSGQPKRDNGLYLPAISRKNF